MIRSLPRVTAVLVLAASAVVMAGCASPAPEAGPTVSATPTAPAPSKTPQPEPTTGGETPTASDEPTCETIISPATVADFASLGWTNLADPLQVGTVDLAEGVQCVWGDFSTANDHVQVFGWGAITPDQAATAQADLLAQGWHQEDEGGTVYITQDAASATATDDEGYGLTYQFGDGWVKFADTKQGLLLVQWPPS